MASTIAPDVQAMANRMSQEFESAIRRASGAMGPGSRDYDPSYQSNYQESQWGAPSAGATLTDTEVQERFFPFLETVLTPLVSAIPSMLEGIQHKNRDIVPPGRDPEQMQRDFFGVISALAPELVKAVPGMISSLRASTRELPGDQGEAQARFLGSLVSAIAPVLIKAAPAIASSFLGGRRDLGTQVTDPQIASRFLGPLVGTAISVLAPKVPKLISMLTD